MKMQMQEICVNQNILMASGSSTNTSSLMDRVKELDEDLQISYKKSRRSCIKLEGVEMAGGKSHGQKSDIARKI